MTSRPAKSTPLARSTGPDLARDPAVALGEGPALAFRAHHQVAAALAGAPGSAPGHSHRRAVDQEDAFVARHDLGNVALRKRECVAVVRQRLEDHVDVESPAATTKIERPPMPSSGFTTILPCSFRNASSSARERVMRLGGVHCGNHEV